LLDDGGFYDGASQLLRLVRRSPDGSLRIGLSQLARGSSREAVARILQQLKILEARPEYLLLTPEAELLLEDPLTTQGSLSEADLWKKLDAQRRRALLIEQLVLQEERRRLIELKRSDLASAVFRISKYDVGAGYDIASFEADGSPRMIEVKSAVGSRIRFVWSRLERDRAESGGSSYWVYFVPCAHRVTALPIDIVMIPDPMARIHAGTLVESPYTFEVTAPSPGPGIVKRG
jgi:hypothetical protein